MNREIHLTHVYIAILALIASLVVVSVGCNAILPLPFRNEPTATPYYCEAEIYRPISTKDGITDEFTEQWRSWVWPDEDYNDDDKFDALDAKFLCEVNIDDYIVNYMSPQNWSFRDTIYNLPLEVNVKNAVKYDDEDPPPAGTEEFYLAKLSQEAVDCSSEETDIPPPTYGAPIGGDITSAKPPSSPSESELYVINKKFELKDFHTKEVLATADPGVKRVILRFAERTGLPIKDENEQSQYITGEDTRHIRFSDIFVELEPFDMIVTDSEETVKIESLYFQSLGTVLAKGTGSLQTYKTSPDDAKFYLHVEGPNIETVSECIDKNNLWADIDSYFIEDQGPGNGPLFVANLDVEVELKKEGSSTPDWLMTLQFNLQSPQTAGFDAHQPVVTGITCNDGLCDQITNPQVTLKAAVFDHDPTLPGFPSEIDRVLWFENFETANETFLGIGNSLTRPFTSGDHEVTAVVYDLRGAYNSLAQNLKGVPNVSPEAANESYSVDEDVTLEISSPGVLANDTDANGDTLIAEKVTDPKSGELTLNSNGSFKYVPHLNFCGSDSFTYQANDGQGGYDSATVSITVNCINDLPEAVDDTYETKEDKTLNVSAPGVLENDSDVDGDTLTAEKVSGPAYGELTLNSNGSFKYVPNPNFYGNDSFTYQANDGQGDSDSATVNITVKELSFQEELEDLKDMVKDQVEDNGIETSLIAEVDAALAQINNGNTVAGCNLLKAFLNEVNALVKTKVFTTDQAQPLIDRAKNIQGEYC